MSGRPAPQMRYWALSAATAAFMLNVVLRVGVRLPSPIVTLLAATLVALGVAGFFVYRYQRLPEPFERYRLLVSYSLVVASLYLLLFGLMWLQDAPGAMGQFLLVLHAACYPLALLLFFKKSWMQRWLGLLGP